jgi:hypothetical protein
MNSLPELFNYIVILIALSIALILLLWQRKAVRGLTLSGPWWWSLIALLALGAVETLIALRADFATPGVSEPLRFIALTSLFTPLMSLMGAKRPQDGAWHFIVVSLWAILALPAAETLFLQRGQALEVYDARCWFMLALVVISALNLGLVRWWPSAVLIALAELLMLAEYLPGLRASLLVEQSPSQRMAIGCCLLAVGTVLLFARVPRLGKVPPWDRLWLAFRDSFGALWAIRIAEQINQIAEKQQWSFRLRWAGFREAATGKALEQSPFEQEPVLGQVVENQFRRFVNVPWIEERLGRSLAELKGS